MRGCLREERVIGVGQVRNLLLQERDVARHGVSRNIVRAEAHGIILKVNSVAAADHEALRWGPGDAHARTEVFIVYREVRIAWRPECAGPRVIGPSGVARVVRNGFNVVAETEVKGQSRQQLE